VESGRIDPWLPVPGHFTLPADRGRILACEHRGHASDHESYVLQYVSEGPRGVVRRVTALASVPTGKGGHVPTVAVNHGTSGLGPECGPTHTGLVASYMSDDLVKHGYAVVATDYQGMGVDDGVHPYLVGEAEAFAVLDGVKALTNLHEPAFDASQLSGELFLLGHSQGGHATLFAHQLFDERPTGRLLGSVSFAPGLGSLHGFKAGALPESPTGLGSLFALMMVYAAASYGGEVPLDAFLTPTAQARLPGLFHDRCIAGLVWSVPREFPTLGALFTPGFLKSMRECSWDGAPCPPIDPIQRSLLASVPGHFHSAAPALILQGETDAVVSPASVACIDARLRAAGTPVQTCAYGGVGHLRIVGSAMPDAIAWMEAVRKGLPLPACQAPLAAACQ
jgi:acetyl esterase/lipase